MSWAITGVGAVASIGRDTDEVFSALLAGRDGLRPQRGFDQTNLNASQLFEIDDRAGGPDRPCRATGFLLDAVAEAVSDAGLTDLTGVPVLVGTGLRELRSVELWARGAAELTTDQLHFGTALRERFGATDTHTFANACSASLYALALGTDLLEQEATDTVVVAGVDSITETMFGLSDRVQLRPPAAVRPFDDGRMGTILGEGAAAVVLRRDTAPRAPLGRVRAVAVNCDAYHSTAPDPDGVRAAIVAAHRLAGVKPDDIGLVVAHGTGTPLNDHVEAAVTREIFAGVATQPLFAAIKSMTGHTSGAAGLLNLIVALRSMTGGQVPPITGLTDPIVEVRGFPLPSAGPLPCEATVAQVHAFGFGGINAVAIVEVGA
ncbi:3-oxoacyl-ACP synthase [Actinophytocola xinjiangensis]|uniref:3-oxoacyl-ACP synthase n=1 Tax=Actinophytocola xinjiangensis TaxID=485602 RepID=A0A7Z0WJZ6_9PSEU|nr:beta-ketoacyl synthase N-terminal-like domain-containing protein [Actinophytocola xinjiangensis]OLF09100.1 3-oxoacyl-ACP synthase [Actinophytocola xinjiangensis]